MLLPYACESWFFFFLFGKYTLVTSFFKSQLHLSFSRKVLPFIVRIKLSGYLPSHLLQTLVQAHSPTATRGTGPYY